MSDKTLDLLGFPGSNAAAAAAVARLVIFDGTDARLP